jgi:hypothetical protein
MITAALILLSAGLLISGKMPVLGGKVIRGAKVRYAGALIFLISVCSFFLSRKISLTINVLILVAIVVAYFFLKGEAPTEAEAKTMLFSSAEDEKKTYSTAIVSLIVFFIIILVFSGGVWLLLRLIKGT